jgi:CheY-like chemotaxis protein/predicted regulator of Ras-like GTPase activity (Roadblock/LC7/MglB family)
MTPPRILLVDDQRQVSRVLRSSLELSGREYLISDVTSAEEALVEMDRAPIDLLVTDLRLPAMSGLELVERAKSINPKLQTILITGNATEEVRQRAEVLGVVAFLPKPIGTNFFLEIVQAALEVADEKVAEGVERKNSRLMEHASDLRQQVGAEAVLLVDDSGDVMIKAGKAVGMDINSCLAPLMSAHRASITVSQKLGAAAPLNFHHLDGASHDLYLITVGEKFGLVIVHQGAEEAGQLGAVMHFGRRTADIMLVLLEEAESLEREQEPAGGQQWEAIMSDPEDKKLNAEDLEVAAQNLDSKGAEDFWQEASKESLKHQGDEDSLTYEEARELGLIEDDQES